MKITEMLRLQGMSPNDLVLPGEVSQNNLGRIIGNSMAVNVLERIFVRALPAAGLTGPLHDGWASRVLPESRQSGTCRRVA